MTTITLSPSAGASGAGLAGLFATVGRMGRVALRRHKIRQDRRVLQSMPDYLLHDLGISRSEIEPAIEFGRERGPRGW